MELLNPVEVLRQANSLVGTTIYLHFEINPNGYLRNGRAALDAIHVKGDGPYRVFLTLDGGVSLLQLNDLTHMEFSEDIIMLTGYDDQGRIAQLLEFSPRPFAM